MILARKRVRLRHGFRERSTGRERSPPDMSDSSPPSDWEDDDLIDEKPSKILNRGAGMSRRRRSQLCDAVRQGTREHVDSLLESGVDVNELGFGRGYAEPAIVTAVRYEHYHIVPILLKRQANVNQPNGRGHTALLRACQKNHIETIKLLLEHGADTNSLDSSHLSALYWAVKNSEVDVVRMLLAHDADTTLTLQHSTTALHLAAAAPTAPILRLLLEKTKNTDPVDDFGETPLFGALRANNFDTACAILASGVDVNVANSDLRTPLHVAAANVYQNVDLVLLLLDHGACVNVVDRYGHTPLVLSLRDSFFNHRSNFSVPEALVRHGSSLNDEHCARSIGWSVLSHGNFDLVRMAVNAGFQIRQVDWVNEFLQGKPGRRRWYTSNSYSERNEQDFLSFLRAHLSQPASLADACRLQIRRSMTTLAQHSSIYYRIQQLPLPQPIIMFLLLEE